MNTIRLQQRGTLTLPKQIRESLKLTEGEMLRVSTSSNKIVIERVETSDTQLFRDIKNSLNEIKDGKFIEFSSIKEFKKNLKSYDAN